MKVCLINPCLILSAIRSTSETYEAEKNLIMNASKDKVAVTRLYV